MHYLKSITVVCVMLSAYHNNACAQFKSNFYASKHEVGINVSAMLSNVISINSSNIDPRPYGLFYAYHLNKSTFRLGAAYNSERGSELVKVSQGNTVVRLLTQAQTQGRASFERHCRVAEKVQVNFGLDALGEFDYEAAIITGSYLNATETLWFGGGPAMRLQYKISPRISLLTEATLYGRYGISTKRLQDFTPIVNKVTSNLYSVNLQAPINLYLNFSL